jgi:hypothetical protein
MFTTLMASSLGCGGSIPNKRGGSPLCTQRQNFFSAVRRRCLVERTSVDCDFNPFAAAGDDGEHRRRQFVRLTLQVRLRL